MPAESEIHFYGEIQKFEASENETLTISGIASSECVDADGEILTAEAMRNALPAYLQKGTVREMHGSVAAGTPISAHVDDDGKTHFTALIADKSTIQKIKLGILKGFSIGGKALKKVGNKITELLLRDISVVDRPCNPEAVFDIIKFDKTPMKKCKHCDEDMEKCGGKCSGAMAEKKKDERIESLFASVDTLVKGFDAIKAKLDAAPAPALPAELVKMQTDLGNLQKILDDAKLANIDIERSGLIQKMQGEGRVVLNDEGKAYTPDELKKFDMPTLKILAKNAQALPLVARAVYKGEGGGPDEKSFLGKDGKQLTGDAMTEAGMIAAGYGDLNKMMVAHKLQ
jgi:hypothetical protein